jgi:putative copper export protein/mono/diheme cytochrome c family protein
MLVLTLTRALHFAAMVSLAGSLSFAALIAAPAFAAKGRTLDAPLFRKQLMRLNWVSLVLGLVSGAVWLVLEARSMSGHSIADVFAQGTLGTVLTRTHFGHDWVLRAALVVPLAGTLVAALRPRPAMARLGLWAGLALGATELATLAGAGHAAAGSGRLGDLQLLADSVHLLAAGAWVGGLLPLALLFAAARQDQRSPAALAAADATARFSVLGIVAVGTLLATGVLNTVFLVGSVPSLLGTDYGRLLTLKIALFLAMVVFAAVNRQWLAPQLRASSRGGDSGDPGAGALQQLQRNALIEAGLGAAVLIVLGSLGTTAPALHVQPEWPLPFRLSLDALEESPEAQLQALLAGAGALCGLTLLGYGLYRPRQRMIQILLGSLVFLALGWWPLQFMVVTAYPTSFYRPAVPLTVQSVMRGAEVFADTCAACHGADGRGDGPAAKGLAVKPADLTGEHVFEHADGDLFWWISQGIPDGGMPGFAESLDERRRWDVINFIHARASAAQPLVLVPEVTPGPAPLAPDFAFDQAGQTDALRQAVARGPILLLFYRLPSSQQRLDALASAERALSALGLRLLALPVDGPAAESEAQTPLPDFAATTEPDTAKAYALFAGGSDLGQCEFLIDRPGFIRARWRGAAASTLPTEEMLAAQIERLAALPLEEQAHAHVHAH